jgi:hypothetical protein
MLMAIAAGHILDAVYSAFGWPRKWPTALTRDVSAYVDRRGIPSASPSNPQRIIDPAWPRSCCSAGNNTALGPGAPGGTP